MLISTNAEVKWNSRNKRHYCDLGYVFTKMGDPFSVKVNDLTNGSTAMVEVECDYCKKRYMLKWDTYNIMKKRTLSKDCCRDCLEIKASEAVAVKYGDHSQKFFACNDKRTKTNIERYGVENVFASDCVKETIVRTNMERYGVPYTQQCDDVRNKTRSTCMKKYGVENYVELFKGKFIKENSPTWKGGVEYSRVDRATYEYIQWRKQVFARDRYTCKCCGKKNGNGCEVTLNAHHIRNWRDNPDERYDISNGITLCDGCHNAFHSIYGKRNNTQEQLTEFLSLSDKKVC